MVLPLHLQMIHEKYYAATTEYLGLADMVPVCHLVPVSVNAKLIIYNLFKFEYTIGIRPVGDVEFQFTGA